MLNEFLGTGGLLDDAHDYADFKSKMLTGVLCRGEEP